MFTIFCPQNIESVSFNASFPLTVFIYLAHVAVSATIPGMVKEYFAALFHSWVGKMSGPASVLLGFLPLLWPQLFGQSKFLSRATWIAALVCFFVANYSAWKYERDKYETEKSKNGRPEIKGHAAGFDVDGKRGHMRGDSAQGYACFEMRCYLDLCNHRPVPTNLTDIKLDGSKLDPPMEFQEVQFDMGKKLEFGIGIAVTVTARVVVDGFTMTSLRARDFSMDDLAITVVDGFGDSHPIDISYNERLRP